MRGIEFITKVVEGGCVVSTSHRLNKDGYLRVRDYREPNVRGRKPLIMKHRLVWEEANGIIPDGHEVDHMCRNRACFNLGHLRLLSRKEHLKITNETRYAYRTVMAETYWRNCRCTGTRLAEVFGVSFSIGCKWIRDWKCVETIR